MDHRFKEIIAATDLLIAEWERARPPTCQDAVELNWKLRKLQIARGLLVDVAATEPVSHSRTNYGATTRALRPYRARVE